MRTPTVSILTGIYPPDSGGPATFAVSFSDFAFRSGYPTRVISLTDGKSLREGPRNKSVKLISRKSGLIMRTFVVIGNITKLFLTNSRVIANGFFIETYLASMITGGKYVAKIPGDIVWERAINSKYSNLEVRDFQNTKLNLKYGFFRYLFSKSILRAETVVVPSPLLFELCLLWGVPENKIHLIFNSIDVEYFIPNGFSNREYDCIVVNRLVAWKNVPEIIRACHSLNLTLLIVGDGPEMHTLRALADDLNSKVLFMGNSAHDELLRYLQSAKFYILNSTADATAYSLLEARSCGLIAIANMETGASEVIDHGKDGFLTKTTDQSELESVLTALLQREPSELEEMSLRARKSTVQKFNKNDNFSQILELTVNSNAR